MSKKKKSIHPKVGQYYLHRNELIEILVINISKKSIMRKKLKEKWFHTQEYEETGETEETIDEIWWWKVGENKLPGKGLMHTTSDCLYYNWGVMNIKANILIHQARIIHTLEPKNEK